MNTNVLGSGADNVVIDGGALQINDFGGNDRYTISPELATSGITGPVVVNDSSGGIINLPAGLVIDEITFSATGVQITVGGIDVQFVGTTNFSVNVAGNPLDSGAGNLQTLAAFAASVGSAVPAMGNADPVAGGTVLANGTLQQDGGENAVELPVGGVDLQTVTGVAGTAENFSLDVVAAQAETDNTLVDLAGFLAAEDMLTFDLANATGPTTLDALNGMQGIAVQDNPFVGGGSTTVNFGPDGNGDVIILTLLGVTDPATVNVDVI